MDLNDSNQLGTYHISENIQNYETARSNFFTFIISDLDDLLYPEFSYGQDVDTETSGNASNEYVTGSTKGKQKASDVLRLSVNKMFVPHFKVNPIEIKRGNSSVKFADSPSWEGGTIELQDFVGLETKNVLMAWQALVYDVNSDTQGRAGDWTDDNGIKHKGYKRDCQLVEYTPDFQQIRYWILKGCWISGITESNFEKDGTGGRTISAQVEFDRAYMHMPDGTFK